MDKNAKIYVAEDKILNYSKTKILYFLPLIIFMPFFILKQMNLLPHYLSVDSSLFYPLDSLIFNGGGKPAHLFHPDTATLWFESIFIFPIAKLLGLVSISTIQEYQASTNPYLNFVDVIVFIRIIRGSCLFMASSFIYIGLIKLFDETIETLSDINRIIVVSFLALCSFAYIAPYPNAIGNGLAMLFVHLVRYEQPAVMWGALSFLMMICAAQTQKVRYIAFMGLFSGMAFLSKIVLLPSVILYVIIYFILNLYYYNFNLHSSKKQRKLSLILSMVLVVLTVISFGLMVVLLKTNLIAKAEYSSEVSLKHLIFTAFPFIFISMLAMILSYLFNKFSDKYHAFSYYISRLVVFLICMYLPLVFQLFHKNGIYLFTHLYLFSFALGQISMSINTGYNSSDYRIHSNIKITNVLLIVSFGLSGLFYLYKTIKNKSYSSLALVFSIFSISFITFLNIVLLRNGEVALGFYTLFITFSIFLFLLFQKTKNTPLLILIMMIGILFQGYNTVKYIKYFNTTIPMFQPLNYRIGPIRWYGDGYLKGDGHIYAQTLYKIYPTEEEWLKAFYWAKDIYHTKQLLQSLNGNPNQLQNSAIAFKEVLLPHYNEVLETISSDIQYSLVLPIFNSGFIGVRSDYEFYIVTEEKLNDINPDVLEITKSQFNNYYVYKIIKIEDFHFSPDQKIRYMLINDSLAKSLAN